MTDAMSAAVVARERVAEREERAVVLRLVGAGIAALLGMLGLTYLLRRLASGPAWPCWR